MRHQRFLFLGDSLHQSYRTRLGEVLAEDGITLVGPAASTGDAAALAGSLEAIVERCDVDGACFGCGPVAAELLAAGGGAEFAALPMYERDVLCIGEALRRRCGNMVLFVTMPPVDAERFRGGGSEGREEAAAVNRQILAANEGASGMLAQISIGGADLYRVLDRDSEGKYQGDGVRLSQSGIEAAAEAVAKGIYGLLHA